MFEPIAIIGQSCLVPGAFTPQQLWENVLEQRISLSAGTTETWRIDPNKVLTDPNNPQPDLTWTTQGGYVRGFDDVFQAQGFKLSVDEIQSANQLIQWLLHVGREAIHSAGYSVHDMAKMKSGAIVGNLSYPSRALCEYAESIWLESFPSDWLTEVCQTWLSQYSRDPRARFMSGLPVHMLAQGLGLTDRAYAIDAACASSLYAIKLACDKLHDRSVDVMLAGGLSSSDHLVIHMGFCAFQAMSRSGQCKPFHQDADGLIPGEGAGLVMLKRLDDAIADHNDILAVIRGIGLSNDGRTAAGFLAPSELGQVAAIRNAYQLSGLSPEDISWVECHATGTHVGDRIELSSMAQIFTQDTLSVGTLKGQIGHLITASGIPAMSKVMSAMQQSIKPPSLQLDALLPELASSAFTLHTQATSWETINDKPRRAGINNFGFGGNNAHLILEEWRGQKKAIYQSATIRQEKREKIAIVGMGVMAAACKNTQSFADALLNQQSQLQVNSQGNRWGCFDDIELDIHEMRYAPNDLKKTLGQQLAMLKVTDDAIKNVAGIQPEKTSVLVGMQCDAEVSRPVLMWRFPEILNASILSSDALMKDIKSIVYQSLSAADSVGTMPNIVTNRINSQYDFKGPSFSVSSEELSGLVGLEIASRALHKKEIDTAIVGAVDLCCEEVHIAAAKAIFSDKDYIPGDAAVVFVLQRLSDAKKQHNTIYAIMDENEMNTPDCQYRVEKNRGELTPLFGHSHVASGLLHIAAGALRCYHDTSVHHAHVQVNALGEQSMQFNLREHHQLCTPYFKKTSLPIVRTYRGKDRLAVLTTLKNNQPSNSGTARLAIVAETKEQFKQRRQQAEQLLKNTDKANVCETGIYYYEKPVQGKVAFVFPGAMTTYQYMGFELVSAFPQLLENIFVSQSSLQKMLDHIYDVNQVYPLNLFDELKTNSFLCQFHAAFTQKILGLKPNATIGCSSGESNALVALQAWRDVDDFFAEIDEAGIYTRHLAENYAALKLFWDKENTTKKVWTAWRVKGNLQKLKQVIDGNNPLLHLMIIHSPTECIVGGDKKTGDALFKTLTGIETICLGPSLLVHAPGVSVIGELWRRLHHRKTYPIADVRVYSAAKGDAYAVNRDSAADALLGQATATVDFPRVVLKAWQDGARIFVEHGPRGLSTGWIDEILQGKEHVAVALDKMGTSSLLQAAYASAHLFAAGVEVDMSVFQ